MYFPGITKQMKQVPKVVMSGKHQMKQTYQDYAAKHFKTCWQIDTE